MDHELPIVVSEESESTNNKRNKDQSGKIELPNSDISKPVDLSNNNNINNNNNANSHNNNNSLIANHKQQLSSSCNNSIVSSILNNSISGLVGSVNHHHQNHNHNHNNNQCNEFVTSVVNNESSIKSDALNNSHHHNSSNSSSNSSSNISVNGLFTKVQTSNSNNNATSVVRKLSFSVENILDPNKFTGKTTTSCTLTPNDSKSFFATTTDLNISNHHQNVPNFHFSFKDVHGMAPNTININNRCKLNYKANLSIVFHVKHGC